jgi:hypothetical protein
VNDAAGVVIFETRPQIDSTDAFEAWMRKRTDVSRKLLKKKTPQDVRGTVSLPAGDILPVD